MHTEPVILSTTPDTVRDFARVRTEPHRRTFAGVEWEVDSYWLNGPAWPMASGHKIKKNGTLHAVRMSEPLRLSSLPENVRAAFATIGEA